MGLDVVAPPDPAHAGFADPLRLRHRSATPMRASFGFSLQSSVDDGLDSSRIVTGLPPPAGSDLPKRLGTAAAEALAPRDERSYGSRRSQPRSPSPFCGRQRPGQCGNVALPAVEFPWLPPSVGVRCVGLVTGRESQWRGARLIMLRALTFVHLFVGHYTSRYREKMPAVLPIPLFG